MTVYHGELSELAKRCHAAAPSHEPKLQRPLLGLHAALAIMIDGMEDCDVVAVGPDGYRDPPELPPFEELLGLREKFRALVQDAHKAEKITAHQRAQLIPIDPEEN